MLPQKLSAVDLNTEVCKITGINGSESYSRKQIILKVHENVLA